jgi:hypothetical protein
MRAMVSLGSYSAFLGDDGLVILKDVHDEAIQAGQSLAILILHLRAFIINVQEKIIDS